MALKLREELENSAEHFWGDWTRWELILVHFKKISRKWVIESDDF